MIEYSKRVEIKPSDTVVNLNARNVKTNWNIKKVISYFNLCEHEFKTYWWMELHLTRYNEKLISDIVENASEVNTSQKTKENLRTTND